MCAARSIPLGDLTVAKGAAWLKRRSYRSSPWVDLVELQPDGQLAIEKSRG
jgi:hypothetical protein